MKNKVKHESIRNKMVLFIAIVILIVYSLSGFVIASMVVNNEEKNAKEYMESISREYGNLADAELEIPMDAARTLADVFSSFKDIEAGDRRNFFNSALIKVLENNEQFLGTWTCWEPNALDGLDEEFKDGLMHDSTGRFVPYWYREESGKIVSEALIGYDTPGDGDYYLLSKNSGNEVITEPYKYVVGGKEILITSLVAPIKNESGKVVGVAGIDVALDHLEEVFSSIKLYESGYGRLISHLGLVVTHPNIEETNILWDESKDGSAEEIFSKINKGETFTSIYYSESLNENVTKSFVPVFVGYSKDAWVFSSVVPTDEILVSAKQIMKITTLVFIAGGLLIIFFIWVIASAIVKPLKVTAGALEDIALGEGDLTRRLDTKKMDEIGQISVNFNLTIEKIEMMLKKIRSESNYLNDVGDDLSSNMEETASAVHQISANIDGIKNQTKNQEDSVTGTQKGIEEVVNYIEHLDDLIEKQSSSVLESSSAIEQMVANIKSVSNILEKNTVSVNELLIASVDGTKGINEVTEIIEIISNQSEALIEAGNIIQNISSQTNLLSMNAAIEAAHAGDSGKGFAVVADEIRKLAETSGIQGKSITEVLSSLKVSIDRVIISTNSAQTQFVNVNNLTQVVKEQELIIKNAMEEQNEGGIQVLNAVKEISDITADVKDGSSQMLSGSRKSLKEMNVLSGVTQEISNSMTEMSAGTQQINVAINEVNDISRKNMESINNLKTEVSLFKIGD